MMAETKFDSIFMKKVYTLTFDKRDIILTGGKHLLTSQRLLSVLTKIKELHTKHVNRIEASRFESDTKEFLLHLIKKTYIDDRKRYLDDYDNITTYDDVTSWSNLLSNIIDHVEHIINVVATVLPNYIYNIRILKSIIEGRTIVMIIENMEDHRILQVTISFEKYLSKIITVETKIGSIEFKSN